jgi:hypothetical protein
VPRPAKPARQNGNAARGTVSLYNQARATVGNSSASTIAMDFVTLIRLLPFGRRRVDGRVS